ncbi:MAG: hypothetical protein Q9200_003416 [Gallowayella weberi]
MALDPHLVHWAQLDEHDLRVAKHVQAQRLEYQRRQQVEADPEEALQDDLNPALRSEAILRPEVSSEPSTEDNNASIHIRSSNSNAIPIHRARSVSFTARVDEVASDRTKIQLNSLHAAEPPGSQLPNIHDIKDVTDTDTSSDSTLSDVPSDLSDEPPSPLKCRNTAPCIDDSRLGLQILRNADATSFQQSELIQPPASPPTATAIPATCTAEQKTEERSLPGSYPVIAFALNSAFEFWTQVGTTLLATCRYCQPPLKASFVLTRLIAATFLTLLPALLLTCVLPALLFLIVALITRLVGTTITTALDDVGVKSCQMFIIGGICSFTCGSFPTAGVILFPRTCTPYTTQTLPVQTLSYWEAEIDVNDINSIPQVLNLFKNRCSYYSEIIESLPPGSGVSEEEKNRTLHKLSVLCTMLGGLHKTLPDLYRYVSTFMAVLLSHIDQTEVGIERSLNGSSENALLEQQQIRNNVPNFAALLQERYAGIEGRGNQTAGEVQDAVNLAAELMAIIEKYQRQNREATEDVVRTWPLRRRLFRSYGWLRHEPIELRNNSIVSNALRHFVDGFVVDIHRILHTCSNNVTNLNTGLKDMAVKSYKSDVESFLDPDGMLHLRSWYGGYKIQAQNVQNNIGSPRKAKERATDNGFGLEAKDKTGGHP